MDPYPIDRGLIMAKITIAVFIAAVLLARWVYGDSGWTHIRPMLRVTALNECDPTRFVMFLGLPEALWKLDDEKPGCRLRRLS